MKQFRDYRIWVIVPAAAVAVQVGIWWAAADHMRFIETRGSADIREIERWRGLTQSLVPLTAATVTTTLVLIWRLMPVPTGNDTAALRQLARKKLGQPMLTESEQALWTQVLEEINESTR